jgi:lysophospholipase L1-like esterase
MKNKIRALIGLSFIFLISAFSVAWYLNSGGCKNGNCGPEDAMASVTYSICISGDSIAYGMGDSAGGWVSRLEYYLLENYPGSAIGNYSFPGATVRNVLDDYNSGCGSQQANISVLAVGINDTSHSVDKEAFTNNLKELYARASKASPIVAFVGLTSVNEGQLNGLNYRNQSIAYYDDLIKEFSSSVGANYIEMRSILGDGDFSEDGLHPNDSGHEKMFLKIKDFMESTSK